MKKGFTALVVIVLITLIGMICLAVIYFINSGNNTSGSNVKGASANELSHEKPGVSVFVSSAKDNWELNVYLCSSFDECSSALTSGRRWSTIGGGETPMHEVVISYDPPLVDYGYVKFFVKPATPGIASYYKIKSLGDVPQSQLLKVTESGNDYQVAVMPLSKIASGFYKSVSFSDN